ncbi:MAG: tRNA uridine-5-carboxymethylaminomethyl(34) synthesis enzyme MnmG [Planctomycetaceae bacterium]|nr:tRNA uridine-5-carboxymethylaminomethyl(34) synthesis enzyme MnmG [Planctomycetaceae bacterium]
MPAENHPIAACAPEARDRYEVVVIGGGHAGTEAARAAAAALGEGGRVALVSMEPARLGQMSCNPAIGGLAKGQMVREIDALGGIMGIAADASGIQFKVLNASKGPAVRGPRAQCDKYAYRADVQRQIAAVANIDVFAGTVDEILVDADGAACGVLMPPGAQRVGADLRATESNARGDAIAQCVFTLALEAASEAPRMLAARAVVLTTGTFMRALMHTGEERHEGGRIGEGSARGISGALKALGFELGRLKTGTPPRVARASIDWDSLKPALGDATPVPFSDRSPHALPRARFPNLAQTDCRETATTPEIHALIRENLSRAPMYSGQIDAECGPRYCPSIEDKIVRFADRDAHHVFLEPESLFTDEIYLNGVSTSLPADVQLPLVRGLRGLERAEIQKFGYAVEYDMVWPHQIDATGETKRVPRLFLAGQINGTSGYEEAGAQGLIAGVNAARRARGLEPVRLARSEAYTGVMFDDLVTRTPREPYRMFTSRAEHRLLLRADNADERLTPLGAAWGIVGAAQLAAFDERMRAKDALVRALGEMREGGARLLDLAKRPDVDAAWIAERVSRAVGAVDAALLERVMTDVRYEGYVVRQNAEVRRQADYDSVSIPESLDPHEIRGLRREAVECLARFRPRTLGQASRLAGISPADITVVAMWVRRTAPRG